MCVCGKGHTVPDPTPGLVLDAGLLMLSGKIDAKGGFRKRVDAGVVRANIAFLREFAVSRVESARVVRLDRPTDMDEEVINAACETVCWLDAVAAVQNLHGD